MGRKKKKSDKAIRMMLPHCVIPYHNKKTQKLLRVEVVVPSGATLKHFEFGLDKTGKYFVLNFFMPTIMLAPALYT